MTQKRQRRLDSVRAAEPTPDQQTVALWDEEARRLENERMGAEIADLEQDRTQRKAYSNRLFWLIVCWLAVAALIVLLQGFECAPFNLSVTVLATWIGSTTATVLGLFAIVANYLFPRR